jgi:hypothetical protein
MGRFAGILAYLADLPELWRLPLRRGKPLRKPERPEIRSKSEIKSFLRTAATSANDRLQTPC